MRKKQIQNLKKEEENDTRNDISLNKNSASFFRSKIKQKNVVQFFFLVFNHIQN